MLKTRNLPAYKDLAVLFSKYARKDFRIAFDPDELLLADEGSSEMEPDVRKRARAFAEQLQKLGPTYVKFGQILSTRPDVVPPEYIAELESLQDRVEPFSFADVQRIVEEELGVRISKAFAQLDSTPIAAASLGQAHRAVLRDGREVVVKVQRPNVREQVRNELEVFTEIAGTLEQHSDVARKMNLTGAIEQARITLMNELNYVQEARNSEILRTNLSAFPQIHVPRVIADFSTSRVLTTELVDGHKISKLPPISMTDQNYAPLASVITHAYLKQICVDGFWHSDPHPGNVFVRDRPEGPQLVLLDFGMVGRITHEMQDEVIKLLLSISSNRGTEVADSCVRVCEIGERFEPVKFVNEVSQIVASYHEVDPGQINAGQLIFNVIAIANSNDLKAPPELAMLAKTLLHLDDITRRLDPQFDPKRATREYAEELIAQKLQQKFNPRNFYPALLDLNQLVLDMPHRVREILDLLAAGRLSFGAKLTQAEELIGAMHKIANRITIGLVIAALLLSSSYMMRIQTSFRIFGYPGLAILGYLAASIAGFYLIVATLIRDRRDEEKAKMKGR